MSWQTLRKGSELSARDQMTRTVIILLAGLLLAVLGTVRQDAAASAAQTETLAAQPQFTPVEKIYLPVIMVPPKAGITGHVTKKGVAAANVPLTLRIYDSNDESSVATTQTDSNGVYIFSGIASLGPGETYYVRFGPNKSNPAFLGWFFGPDIDDYKSGSLAAGGDFDIDNVVLKKPDHGAKVSLPVTFSWERRGIPGDSYRIVIFDLTSSRSWTTADLGDTGSFTANNLHPDIKFGKTYGWYIEVYNGPNSYGESFEEREVIFTGYSQQSEDRLPPLFFRRR